MYYRSDDVGLIAIFRFSRLIFAVEYSTVIEMNSCTNYLHTCIKWNANLEKLLFIVPNVTSTTYLCVVVSPPGDLHADSSGLGLCSCLSRFRGEYYSVLELCIYYSSVSGFKPKAFLIECFFFFFYCKPYFILFFY